MMPLPNSMSSSTDRTAPIRVLAFALGALALLPACQSKKDVARTAPQPPPPRVDTAAAAPRNVEVPPGGQLIDRVVANVSGRIVLYSELAGAADQARQNGESVTPALVCAELEDKMFQGLLLDQARIDSVVVDPKQVEAELEHRIRYFEQQIGGREKLEKFYGRSIERIKADFREQVRDQLLVQQMRGKIAGEGGVTPREVEKFYRDIPADSLPFINASVEFGRIVRLAKPSEEEDRRIRKKLEDMRARIVEGRLDFAAAASLYSQDPGSSGQGGALGMVPQGVMVPEFDAVALSLKDGEISPAFRTTYGYHIMRMIERRGERYNAAHILLKVESGSEDLRAARAFMDSVAALVRGGRITFAKAAADLNDDEDTKGTNGLVIEPNSNSPRWAIGDLDKETFNVLDKLEPGTLSAPQIFELPTGEKGWRVLLLMKRTGPHVMDLVADYPLVSEAAANAVKQRRVDTWTREKLAGTYVHVVPDYASCPFSYPWIGNTVGRP